MYAAHVAHLVLRQAHEAAVFGKGLENALANPPDSIGDEFEAAGLVELPGGRDESDIPLVDQIRQPHALALVLLGHRNHKAQVGLGQFGHGLLVALADAARQFGLFFSSNHFLTTDVLKVTLERITIAVGDALDDFQLSHGVLI